MENKILILGARGQLGTELSSVFPEAVSWDKKDLDITNQDEVENKISQLKPNIIVNAAGYTKVDDCEKNKELAFKINSQAVEYLAKACQRVGATLVHFSTDYVFSGDNPDGYSEDDQPRNPVNVYGQSKLMGEELLQKNCKNYYLIRTSWLFGKAGKNFVSTILEKASQGQDLKVVNDQFGKPTYALDLAKRVREIIDGQKPFGIYHLTNEEKCSWFEFAQEICQQAGLKVEIEPVTTEQFPTPAKRPQYTILINTKLPLSRPWPEALKEYLHQK